MNKTFSETINGITYTVTATADDIDVRGNALASGDDAADKAYEDEILARLDNGDVWAWASVEVEATITIDGHTFTGSDYLGGCSYADAEGFVAEGGYYQDMKAGALDRLRETLRSAVATGVKAQAALVALEGK